MPSGSFNDFFDFATALLKPVNVKGAIEGLTRKQIIAFHNLVSGTPSKDVVSLDALCALFLVAKVEGKPSYVPLDSAVVAFKDLVTPIKLQEILASQETKPQQPLNFDLADPQAGIAAFETVQALTELVIDLEQRFIREVSRGQVGLPELKRLASHLGRNVEYARLLYSLAQMSSLVVLQDKRWRVGSHYLTWLTCNPSERWLHIAKTWRTLLGSVSATELADSVNLETAFAETFPLANSNITSHMARLYSLAELVGLSSAEQVSSWFKPLVNSEFDEASSLLESHLPKSQSKIIIQADLTIISVGPLPTDKEMELRRFVETERIGVASTYRISTLSVTYGMETGLTEEVIRDLLLELSGVALPQPVDYLIREAATRFGRLVLRELTNGTAIESSDLILLTQIANDSSLRAISISKDSTDSLISRFEMDIVYYQLRESKYAAIRKDASGNVLSNWLEAGTGGTFRADGPSIAKDILRWREHDERLGQAPEGQDIVRQIEMAIRNKVSIQVTVQTSDALRDFTLEPTGLANGRLRGKDRKADCERVLPLASITSVRIG